jgi:hypothetical protein
MFLDNEIIKVHAQIISKVGSKMTKVSFSFDIDKNTILCAETLRLDFIFQFGSFKKQQAIASITYSIQKHLEWAKLNPAVEFVETLHEYIKRKPVNDRYTPYIQQPNITLLSSNIDPIFVQDVLLSSTSSSTSNPTSSLSAVFDKLRYAKSVSILPGIYQVLSLSGLSTIQVNNDDNLFEILPLININEGEDLCHDAREENLFVVCPNEINIIDITRNVTNYTNSNFKALKCIISSNRIIDEFAVVVGEEELHIIDTSSSWFKLGSINSSLFNGVYRACLNTADTKVYAISRTHNKLVVIDVRNKLLPYIEKEYDFDYMIEPRCLLYVPIIELLIVGCYGSSNLIIFDVKDGIPKLERVVGLLQKPCDITFDDNKLYIVGHGTDTTSILDLYDTNENMNRHNYPREYSIDTNENDFVFYDNEKLIVISSQDLTISQYEGTQFTLSNDENIDTSSLDLNINSDGYIIKSINRDVSGNHTLVLDSNYNVKNLNLSFENETFNYIINNDLQCNYTIQFTSKLSVE